MIENFDSHGDSVEVDISHDPKTDQIDDAQPKQDDNSFIPDDTRQTEITKPVDARGQWGSRLSFIITTVGAAVGFGNFLRFPYLVYQHGGGVFLIPYILAIFFIGDKIMLLELSLGQITQKTAIKAFGSLSPHAIGLGISACLFGSFVIGIYYSVIVSWSIVFFAHSFFDPLPWAGDSQKFFFDVVLQKSDGLWHFTGIAWQVTLALLLLWICIFFSIWRGVKSLQIVSWFTVPLPIIALVVFMIRGFFLEGSWNGIYYYLKPDWGKLLTFDIWLAAIGQTFFSMSLAAGIMPGYASFNKRKQNVAQDTILVSIMDCCFSIFSGFCIFQVLGYMAHVKGVSIDKVTASGIGLAFVAFPDAISTMPWPNLVSLLFFTTLFFLGLSSAFSLIETITGNLRDYFPNVGAVWISLVVCIIGFILGIPFTLSNGFYFIDLVDHFASDYCLVGIGCLEAILVGWLISETSIYAKIKGTTSVGWRRIRDFLYIFLFHSVEEWREKIVNEITPKEGSSRFSKLFGPHIDWSLSTKFLVPFFLGTIVVLNIISEIQTPYASKEHGYSTLVFGLIPIACFSIILFFIFLPWCKCQRRKKLNVDGQSDVDIAPLPHEHIDNVEIVQSIESNQVVMEEKAQELDNTEL